MPPPVARPAVARAGSGATRCATMLERGVTRLAPLRHSLSESASSTTATMSVSGRPERPRGVHVAEGALPLFTLGDEQVTSRTPLLRKHLLESITLRRD